MKKLFVLMIFALTSLVMISCEGDLSGITIPTDMTLPTGDITTGDDVTTEIPTTSEGTTGDSESTITDQATTTEEKVTTEEPTTELPTTEVSSEERQAGINNLKLILQANDMMVSDMDAFAAELYDNGLGASELTGMMQDLQPLMMVSPEASMTEIYEMIDDMMESMDPEMMRAILSAVIKVELKNALEMELSNIQPMAYEEGKSEEELMMLEALLEFIELNGDEAVDTVMVLVEYIMDIQAAISPEVVEDIESLAMADQMTAFEINMMVTIKDAFFNAFKNNLPSDQDFLLVNSTFMSLIDIMTDGMFDFEPLALAKQATTQRMSISLMFDFFLMIDGDYVTALLNMAMMPDETSIKLFARETIDLINDYTDYYQIPLRALNDQMTLQEKQAFVEDFLINQLLYMALLQDLDQAMADQVIMIVLGYMDVENMVNLQDMLGETLIDFINQIVLNDYALIDAFIDLAMIDNDDYASYDAYDEAMQAQVFVLIHEALNVINPMVQNGQVQDVNVVIDLVMMALGMQIEIDGLMMTYDVTDDLALYNMVGDTIYELEDNVLSMLQIMVNFIATTDYLDTLEMFVTTMDNQPSEEMMGQLAIEMANAYIDLYGLLSTDLDAFEAEILLLLNDTSFQALTGVTQEDIDNIEGLFTEMLPGILNQAMVIHEYDYMNLTTEEMQDVQDFLMIFFPMEEQPETQPIG